MAGQSWDPSRYAKNARFVAELETPVVELLAPKAGERVLDLGCGALTLTLARLGCDVVGVDSGPEQVAAARRLGLDARVGSGECLEFSNLSAATAEHDPQRIQIGPRGRDLERLKRGVSRRYVAGWTGLERGPKTCTKALETSRIVPTIAGSNRPGSRPFATTRDQWRPLTERNPHLLTRNSKEGSSMQ